MKTCLVLACAAFALVGSVMPSSAKFYKYKVKPNPYARAKIVYVTAWSDVPYYRSSLHSVVAGTLVRGPLTIGPIPYVYPAGYAGLAK